MSRRKRSRETPSITDLTKQNPKRGKSALSSAREMMDENGQALARFRVHILPVLILILVATLAYANAWPDNLTWDDTVFAMGNRLNEPAFDDLINYFTDDAWAAIGGKTGIYRPLLLVSVALDIQLFGEWMAGFHLVNILLQILVTVLVYGLTRYLLLACGGEMPRSGYVAMLAALVFAVHPIHTEVVNSIFNRSEMLVSLGVAGGLWWFLPTVQNHPWRAWSLLGLIYLLVMLCRETGIVLPAITVVFLWITSPGDWAQRTRKCIPVLWLLIPMAIYLSLRAHALDIPLPVSGTVSHLQSPDAGQVAKEIIPHIPAPAGKQADLPGLGLYFTPAKLLPAVTVWFDAIKLILWPDPLLTYHPRSGTNKWIALAAQLVLIGYSIFRLLKKRPGLFLGLAFFYLSFLPSSRIIGEQSVFPHLSERYLYMPTIGMTIVLAFGLDWLAQKFSIKAAVAPVLAAILFLAPLTLVRNSQWVSTLRLAEVDYSKNPGAKILLQTYVTSLLMKGELTKAATLCDENAHALSSRWYLAGNCAQVYANLKRFDQAEQAFISAAKHPAGAASAHYGLAVMYLRGNRRDKAAEQFELSVATEKQEFMQEYLAAEMMMRLYPSDPARLLEAKAHLEKCIELQPQYYHARQRLRELGVMLDSVRQGQD